MKLSILLLHDSRYPTDFDYCLEMLSRQTCSDYEVLVLTVVATPIQQEHKKLITPAFSLRHINTGQAASFFKGFFSRRHQSPRIYPLPS